VELSNAPFHINNNDNDNHLTAPFYGPLSGSTWVSQYQKKHSPTHTYPDHQPSFISSIYYDP